MNDLQILRTIRSYLNRVQIEGHEAESLVVCKQWVRNHEREIERGSPPAAEMPVELPAS